MVLKDEVNFTSQSIKMLRLYYHELMGKVRKHKGKKDFMIYDYVLYKVLNKTKEIIGVKKFDDLKIIIDTDDKFPDNITLKNAVILMTCVIKNDGKIYPQIFFEEAFLEV